MPETQNLIVNYILKGEDVQHAFTKAYTMREHFNDVPRKEGKAFAIKKHGKDCNPIVQVTLKTNAVIEAKLYKHFNLDRNNGFVMQKVHNPLHSCFKGYNTVVIGGLDILCKTVNNGVVYAVVNAYWLREYDNSIKEKVVA